MPNGEQPNTAEPSHSDANEIGADYIITRDESNHADRSAHSRNEQLTDDVTKRNEDNEATRNEESDWPNSAVSPKSQEKSLPGTASGPKNDETFSERNSLNENNVQNSPKRGKILSCPNYLKTMLEMKV